MPRRNTDRLFWESFTKAYPIKATALLIIAAMAVVGCGREGALSRSLDQLDYDSLPAKAPRPSTPADKLHVAATDLEGLLSVQARRALSTREAARARADRATITRQLRGLQRRFDTDNEKLHELGAKAALARLGVIQRRVAALSRSADQALAAVPSGGARAAVAAAKAAKALRRLSPEMAEQPLSSDLGFGTGDARRRPAPLSAGVTPAYSTPVPGETPSDLPRTPEADDLAPTPETRVTPAVHALAQHLGGDPVKIYAYVHDQIAYEPYYGVRKGADQTLAEKAGSDADQAALLIALLRDSGIHARFVRGVVQLPAAAAANWLGIDTEAGERPDAAADLLASAGVPTTQIRANGQLVKVRFDHVWAEAYIPADAYRGTEENLGGKTWLPLDPSIKQTDFQRPDEDFQTVLKPVAEHVARDFATDSSFTGDALMVAPSRERMKANATQEREQLAQVLASHSITADSDVADLLGSRTIRAVTAPYLPSTLPVQPVAVSGELRAVPTSLQARVSFTVSGADPLSMPSPDPEATNTTGFSYTASSIDLANQRITLAYVPATEDDAAIIDAYHGLLNAPAYAAALIPVLRIGGHVVARGHTPVSTGYAQSFEITYRSPGYAPDTVTNPVYVGSLSAVGLDLGAVAGSQLKERARALKALAPSVTDQTVLTDAAGGEMLSQLAALYFVRNDAFNTVLASAAGVRQARALSGAITATNVTPRYLGGFPISVRLDGLTIDVDEDSQVVVPTSGSDGALQRYMRLSGGYASASEADIFEYALGWQAVSTSHVLRAAAEAGIPLHRVTADNADTELARLNLPATVEHQIANAVASGGVEVVTPEREVTVGPWTGVGYVVAAGNSADYRISGGISGGSSPIPPPNGPFGPFDPNGPFGPLRQALTTSAERVDESTDCDYREIAIMAAITIIMAVAAVLFALLALSPVGLVEFEVIAFISTSVGEHLFEVAAGNLLVAGLAGWDALDEAGKC